MKVQIRKNVFETNSSSTHAISISKENNDYRFPENVVFEYGQFGWEEQTLKTTGKKASYLYTALYYVFREDEVKWKEYISFIYDTLKENGVSCEFKGEIGVSVDTWGDSIYISKVIIPDGWIDHGNNALDFVAAVCSDKDLLLSYLFSKNSIIKTGNDNEASDISISADYPHVEFYKGN